MQEMLAAVFEKTGSFVLKQVPQPVVERADEIVIAVEAVSICGTDVHITADPPGYLATEGTILGHELCGIVREKGADVHHLEVGDRVVVNPNNYCGACVYCRKNLPNECEHIEPLGIDFDGAFAGYCKVNGKVAYRVSKEVSPHLAACAEPLACAVNAMKKVNVLPGDSAVIIGAGPIGLILAMLLKASGASNLFILETSHYRANFARGLDLGQVIDPIHEKASDLVSAATGIGADYVFDVTGSQAVTGIDLVRKGGAVVLFGVNNNARAELAQSEITTKEIAVIGTWLANATFPEAVRIIEQDCIDLGRLITDVIPLSEIHAGLEKLRRGEAVKIIVEP